MEKTLYVGKLDGNGVSLKLEIEKKNQRKTTIEHKEVDSYHTLSISGNIRNAGGGQIKDIIRKGLHEYAIPKENLQRILEIWDEYHANDLQAGCTHQVEIPTNIENWSELAAKQTKLCSSGYKYGSAWLLKELPVGLVEEVIGLFKGESVIPEDKMVVEIADSWSNQRRYAIPSYDILINLKHERKVQKEHGRVNRYKVIVKNQEENVTISFPFYDSVHNTKEYDELHDELIRGVLHCIKCDYYNDRNHYPTFKSFCDAFGYDYDSDKDEQLYKEVVYQATQLQRVFDEMLVRTFPE